MITLAQIESDGEVWSLEDDDDDLYLMYIPGDDEPRTTIPIPRLVLEFMALKAKETPIIDRRQKIIPFPHPHRRVA